MTSNKSIYINRTPVLGLGPWGGGSKFLSALIDGLMRRGHSVVNTLQPNIDVLLCIDPRPAHMCATVDELLKYRSAHVNTRLVARVGDLGTHGKPQLTKLLCDVLPHFDAIIYPSMWARDYMMSMLDATKIRAGKRVSVVHNAPLDMFFENRRNNVRCHDVPRVVTHHWSDNPKKGFCMYSELDALDEFEFTYIGRAPADVQFKHHLSPMAADGLVDELPKHDIYLTASTQEAGANHVLEAMACGLPVVYSSNGGSIPEYVNMPGIEYHDWDVSSMLNALRRCRDSYSSYKDTTCTYGVRIGQIVNSFIDVLVDEEA